MADTNAVADRAPAEKAVRMSVSLPKEHYNILASVAR